MAFSISSCNKKDLVKEVRYGLKEETLEVLTTPVTVGVKVYKNIMGLRATERGRIGFG